MKKILLIFFVLCCLFGVSSSYAVEKTIVTNWVQGEKTVVRWAQVSHESVWCAEHQKTHCPYCHVDHWANGDFSKEPVCNCNFTIEKVSNYQGWTVVKSWSEDITHTCGNKPELQEEVIVCKVTYTTIKKECNHNAKCTYGKTFSEHTHITNGKRYIADTSKCQKCPDCGGYIKVVCKECSCSTLCPYMFGAAQHPHTYKGKTYNLVEEKCTHCPYCGGYTKVYCEADDGSSDEEVCDHNATCSKHGKTALEHPYEDSNGITYYVDNESSVICKVCGGYSTLVCKGESEENSGDDDDGEDGETCDHAYEEVMPAHDHNYPDQGSQATTNSVAFLSSMYPISSKTNTFSTGDRFYLSGQCHVAGEVSQASKEVSWECNKYAELICSKCGASGGTGSRCSESGTYTVWENPTYTDTYYPIKISFKGFKATGDSSIGQDKVVSKTTTDGRPDLEDTKYNKTYQITEWNVDELKKDESSGLAYGIVRVECACRMSSGCTCGCDDGICYKEYKIYQDPVPPDIELEPVEWKLTVISNNETAGVVGINDDASAYKVSKTTMSPKNSEVCFGVKARVIADYENKYEFKGWYEPNAKYFSGDPNWYIDAKLMSKEQNWIVTMPSLTYTLVAVFGPKSDRCTVTVYSDGNGTVKIGDQESKEKIEANVAKGDTINIKAIADVNFDFDYWTEIDVTTAVETKLVDRHDAFDKVVNEDYIYKAHFKPASSNGCGELKLEVYGNGRVIGSAYPAYWGVDYNIEAISNDPEASKFLRWDVISPLPFAADYMIDADTTNFGQKDTITMPEVDTVILKAYFSDSLDDDYFQVEVESAGGGYVSIDNNTPTRLYDSLTGKQNDEHTIYATAKNGYEFEYWVDSNGNKIYEAEYKIIITDNIKYTAYFNYIGTENVHTLTVRTGDSTLGKVINEDGRGVNSYTVQVPEGDRYKIKASPLDDAEFDYWTGNGENTSYGKEAWITMPDNDYEVIAWFEKIDTTGEKFNVYIDKEGEGTVTGAGEYVPGDNVLVNATSAEGWEFAGWDGNYSGLMAQYNPNPSFEMPHYDLYLTAGFKKLGNGDSDLSLKVISIRDLNWKDYFIASSTDETGDYLRVPKNADGNTVLVDSANLKNSAYNDYRTLKFGYAVEFELETKDIDEPILQITPAIYAVKTSGGLQSIGSSESSIQSNKADDKSKYLIERTQKTDGSNNGVSYPRYVFRWVYYIPMSEYEGIKNAVKNASGLEKDKIIVKLDLKLLKSNGTVYYDYNQALNSTNKSKWGGYAFSYSLEKTLLDDIYDNAAN